MNRDRVWWKKEMKKKDGEKDGEIFLPVKNTLVGFSFAAANELEPGRRDARWNFKKRSP